MQHRRKIAAAGAGLLVAAAAAGVGSAAAAGGAPKSAKLFVRGSVTYKVDQFAQDSVRFAPTLLTIKTGGTLTIVNKDLQEMEPHTFSIVTKSQLPRTNKQISACQMLQLPICRQIAISHGVDPNSQNNGPPSKPVADVGQDRSTLFPVRLTVSFGSALPDMSRS